MVTFFLYTLMSALLLTEVSVPYVLCNQDNGQIYRRRHSRTGRQIRPLDENTKQILQDLSVKLSNVSSASQLYNVMVRYDVKYCESSVITKLENISKSPASKVALQSMKAYCNVASRRKVQRRGIQKIKDKNSKTFVNETSLIDEVLRKNVRPKTGCRPQKTLVEFSAYPGSILIPRCAYVKRCTGCCSNNLHSCFPQNIKSVKRKYVVIKVHPWRNSGTQMKLKEIELEEHSSCRCGCEMSPSQCTVHQQFHESSCSCKCKNENQYCTSPKTWDSSTCKCECPHRANCTTGYARDPHTCKCVRRQNNLTTYNKQKRERFFGKPK